MIKISSDEKLNYLINKYKDLVFSVCIKLVGDYFAAEDITQETFIKAYMHLDSFDGTSEKAWLCRIASNKCIDYLKSAQRRAAPTLETQMQELESETGDILGEVTISDTLERLKDACRTLPEKYSEIAEMYFVKGMTAKEISDQTELPLKTVQTRIYRTRGRLKKSIRKEDLLK